MPVTNNINFERHDYEKRKTTHNNALGSYIGGLFTIAFLAFMLVYIIQLITQMESGDNDQIKNTVMSNPVGEKGGITNLALKDYYFLPIVEIQYNIEWAAQDHLDIWEGPPSNRVFDLEKYFNYVTWVGFQRNYGLGIDEYVYTQNMRACVAKDFSDRGYTPDEGMLDKMKKRRYLCFDVTGPNGS